jgi:hypothetical protein
MSVRTDLSCSWVNPVSSPVQPHQNQTAAAGRDRTLERACQFHRFGSDDIHSILASGGWAPPARAELGERLVLAGLPKVPRRDLTSYRSGAVQPVEQGLDGELLEGLKRLKLRHIRELAPNAGDRKSCSGSWSRRNVERGMNPTA